MSYRAELNTAVEAALVAGDFLRRSASNPQTVLSSVGKDIKLEADRKSEKLILEVLKKHAFPILAEETGEHGQIDPHTPYWIVDPLDGSMNYIKGLPLCCVSIALWVDDKPLLGVINDFHHAELFKGCVEEGASLNDRAITVSDVHVPEQGVLATGFPRSFNYETESMKNYLNRIKRFKKTRFLGTAALSLAYVACSRVDAYFEQDIMLWDVAAGIALIDAAGGITRSVKSERNRWARNVSGVAHPDLLD